MRFTQEQKEFLKKHIKGYDRYQTIEAFKNEFGIELTGNQVSAFRKNNHIPCGIDKTFKKGRIPHNKGKKLTDEEKARITERQRATWFKTGHLMNAIDPVGTIKWRKDYVMIKTASNKWKLYHRYLWFKEYGPTDNQIIFCDGNRYNCTIENLMEVTDQEALYLNKLGVRGRENIEAALLQMKLEEKIREVECHRCRDCAYYEKVEKGYKCHEIHHKRDFYKFDVGRKCVRFIRRDKNERLDND